MEKALAELIEISNTVGKDATLVQGGGGNTSVKTPDGKYMYIKASGTALKDMNGLRGWRKMNLAAILAVMGDKDLARMDAQKRELEVMHRLLLACDDKVPGNPRPSVEAHLHAFLGPCVIHLHPWVIGAYVNSKHGRAKIETLLSDEKYPPLWVPYVDPGFVLGRKVAQLVGSYETQWGGKPAILILEKHGLFVTTATAGGALRLVQQVISRCGSRLKTFKAARNVKPKPARIASTKLVVRRAFREATGEYAPVNYFLNETIAVFMARKDGKKLLSTAALTPDEIVYSNGPALWCDTCDDDAIVRRLRRQLNRRQKPALAFLIRGQGLFVAADENTAKVVEETASGSMYIRSQAASLGGVHCLSNGQENFINEWEMENYRKHLVSGQGQGQLDGRIALITAAGGPVSRNVAMGLARAGALVALVDLDGKAADNTAELIKKQLPQAAVMTIGGDVTNEASVAATYEALLEKWGGLDILVNVHSIGTADCLLDLPAAKWRQTMETNVTGAFLMTQGAARVMIEQDMGGAIVTIASELARKRGDSTAAADAAGGVGQAVTNSWARELAAHSIRANSVSVDKEGEVADLVVFLCSDKGRPISGQALRG